eukprot:TRINITY_DN7855_c0_g1_i3.p1 TRINITY_DN7855_c0_g1~~TRINITY_DN7855_c0_g1_i3.p1  ORF type:complete len:201 (+),score=66.84 TRINITY_DN7855_c0_g1_i3:113-715(+)
MFHSAWRGYLNFGSDTGGYRQGNRTKELFIRWSQLSTFCPLFENGGEGNHGPWEYDEETVKIYRNFVHIHMELGPYFLSTATRYYPQGKSVMTPMAEETIFTPNSWNFKMGDDIFVSPVVESGNNFQVEFPGTDSWVFWFNSTQIFPGGSTSTFNLNFTEFPVFRRVGSIIPMNITSKYSLFGNQHGQPALTFIVGKFST